ncbi:uncharacterized protein LOC144700050 isoform X2 [Wolffia australiana]
MSGTRRSRYSRSPSRRSDSYSYSRSRSNSRSRSYGSSDAENPGNNLYVTGLSSRVTKEELRRHFEGEGKVTDIHLVLDPWTRESRGFGFVTMGTVGEANRCIKYLDGSVLEGRVITVEKFFLCNRLARHSSSSSDFKRNHIKIKSKSTYPEQWAKRSRGRTPTPGRYLGVRGARVNLTSPGLVQTGLGPNKSEPELDQSLDRRHSRSRSSSRERERSYSPYYTRRGCRSRSRRYRRSYSRDSASSYSRSPSADYGRRCRRRPSPSRSPSRSSTPPRSSYYAPKRRRSPSPRRSRGFSRESYSHSRSSMTRSSSEGSRSPSLSASP